MSKYSELPDPILEFIIRCEEEGYYPSYDELLDKFGEEAAQEHGGHFPDLPYFIEEEFADEEFTCSCLTEDEREMKYAGHKLSDFE